MERVGLGLTRGICGELVVIFQVGVFINNCVLLRIMQPFKVDDANRAAIE